MSSYLKLWRTHLICFLALVSLNAQASYDLYGRIAIDSKSISKTYEGTNSGIENDESKIGLKGKFIINPNSKAAVIYQIEYGIDPVDGKARGDDGTFKQRNTFIGLQDNFGTIFAGTHDSAFKKSQLKVDLFNDLSPDIKNILHGENRLEDFVGYTTPTFKKYFSATFNRIKNPFPGGKNYQSHSLHYKGDKFQAALAVDYEMQGYDSRRASLSYPFKNSRLGLIIQETKKLSTGQSNSGGVISFSKGIQAKGTLKLQYTKSSMKIASGAHSTIGYDHLLTEHLKFFTFYSKLTSDTPSKNKNIFSLGLEYQF